MGKLRTHVHVQDENGSYHVFGPLDEVPAWAAKAIVNPKAWAEAPVAEVVPAPVLPPPAVILSPVVQGTASGAVVQNDAGPVEPPRNGKGASGEAWREYAMSTGWFEAIAPDASRDEIIAAVDEQRAERATKE